MDYWHIAIPLICALLAQATKIITDKKDGRFSFASFYAYGGMPSGHAAFVTSGATVIGLMSGFTSTGFLIALIVAIIVIRDALTLRKYIGLQSKAINTLIQKLPAQEQYEFPVLVERVGHTPAQLLAGSIFGIILSLLLYSLG